jgi:hypothetical protein
LIGLPSSRDVLYLIIEAGAAIVALLLAVALPGAGEKSMGRIGSWGARVAKRRTLSLLIVTLIAPAIRLALLPVAPIPEPAFHDEFSYLLAADTFASGRLTNPTHPMWVHFETFHETQRPTYMSMYFPAQGMLLAAGKVLFGHPWYAVCLSAGLMCGAVCWMLQGWLPTGWALLGAGLMAFRIGISTYWMNSYWGGTLAVIGGALVLGSLPRLYRNPKPAGALTFACGLALLANCRPVETVLLLAGIAVATLTGPRRFRRRLALSFRPRLLVAAATVLGVTGGAMAYYNWRVFGNPLTLPYQVNRAQYAVSPVFLWQTPKPEPVYHHDIIREFYVSTELGIFEAARTPLGFAQSALKKAGVLLAFFLGFVLVIPLAMTWRVARNRSGRFLLVVMGVYFAGLLANVFVEPHYFAPATALIYAILASSVRHLRRWQPRGQAVGVSLASLIPPLCVGLWVVHLIAPINLAAGVPRAEAQKRLESLPGKQLALVRYGPKHDPLSVEWVYNAADIDASKVVWARAMNPQQDLELIRYFKDRTVWLVEPDAPVNRIEPYPMPPGSPLAGNAAANVRKGEL